MIATVTPKSLAKLIKALEESAPEIPRQAARILADAKVSADDLQAWADFEHPLRESYGRKLVYDGGFFEVMVMSWAPGDFSAIHDHGFTMWGAVQVFGPAEHAVFAHNEGSLVTINRTQLTPGRVLAVGHDLIHQMGNPTHERFFSLHVYGNPDRNGDITADARVFNLLHGEVRRTDGGVFFDLPDVAINSREELDPPDYYSWLFDATKHLAQAKRANRVTSGLLADITSVERWQMLKDDLANRVDDTGHITDSRYWKWLYSTLQEMSALQRQLIDEQDPESVDDWTTYASYYDHVIGTTNSYIPRYLRHVFNDYDVEPANVSFLDVGCGTGWLEHVLQDDFGMNRERLLAVDISPAMLTVASKRAETRLAGLLDLDESFGQFDVTYCNSYQYLNHEDLEEAIRRMFDVTKRGGLCISEFISVDHVRWYPNVIISEDDTVISLRNPTLTERNGCTYQENEIININRLNGLRITYESTHRRFLCSSRTARDVIATVFGNEPTVFDSITLDEIPVHQETCNSTRYTVCVRRN